MVVFSTKYIYALAGSVYTICLVNIKPEIEINPVWFNLFTNSILQIQIDYNRWIILFNVSIHRSKFRFHKPTIQPVISIIFVLSRICSHDNRFENTKSMSWRYDVMPPARPGMTISWHTYRIYFFPVVSMILCLRWWRRKKLRQICLKNLMSLRQYVEPSGNWFVFFQPGDIKNKCNKKIPTTA